jgi:hypothetical protein
MHRRALPHYHFVAALSHDCFAVREADLLGFKKSLNGGPINYRELLR